MAVKGHKTYCDVYYFALGNFYSKRFKNRANNAQVAHGVVSIRRCTIVTF